MMDQSQKPPESLMRAIAADLRPVKPSPLPLQLVLRMAPLALLIASLVLVAMGIRRDTAMLGPLLTWGASAAQFVLAIVLVWIAAHESTPAGRLPKSLGYAAAIAAMLAVIMITLSTYSISPATEPMGMPPVPPWIMGLVCSIGSSIAGGILVLLFSRIFRNSLAARPTIAGALYGAGAGVAINATWRISCPISTVGHALGSHGIAIIATTITGALIGRYLGKAHSLK
jgi:hypothetical protein